MDVSSLLNSTGIALEKQAVDTFGAAVDSFTRGALGVGARATPPGRIAPRDQYTWYATSYAAALAGGTNYRPKLKFLFKVQFIFKANILEQLEAGGFISNDMKRRLVENEFTFMIKTVDRPKVDFEYEDDINQYNFRTKVLKKIRHRELTITFMDDVGNRVFDLFRILMMVYSPITRRQRARDDTTNPPSSLLPPGSTGMSFSTPDGGESFNDKAHRAVINSDQGGCIEVIRVKQMFVDPSSANLLDATREVVFDFLNPRLVSFDLDDLSHESSEPNLLTMQFDYDWMEMVSVSKLFGADSPVYNITAPGVTNAPSDILAQGARPAEERTNSNPIPSAGGGNVFANIIARQVARGVQQQTADSIGKAVTSIAGRGTTQTAVAGALSDPIGAAFSGIVGGASSSLLNAAASSSKGSFSVFSSPAASDARTFGRDEVVAKVSSTDRNGK